MEARRPPRRDLERLLAHEGFVRALASGLVGNEHDADDLVQDAWLASLQAPRPRVERPRAWLAAVLRNRWRNLRRREVERPARERRAARAEGVDHTQVERELELRQRLLAAVRSLPERYQSAIFLRYYEGVTVAEVARRTGVPFETARSRIERGLELLRATLDRDFGARGAWAAVAGAWLADAPGGVAADGARASGAAGLALAGAAVAVTLVLGLALAARPRAQASPTSAATASASGGDGATLSATMPATAAGQRDAVRRAPTDAGVVRAGSASVAGESAASASSTEALAGAHEHWRFRISGRVVGADGRPAAGARVYYREPIAVAAEDGRFSCEIEEDVYRDGGTQRHAANPLVAVVEGRIPAVVPRFGTTLPRGSREVHDVEVVLGGPALSIAGVVLDPAGAPASGWRVALRDPTHGLYLEREHRALEELAAGRESIVPVGEDGRFEIAGLFDRPYDLIAWEPEGLRHALLEDVPAGGGAVTLAADPRALPRRIAGRVVSAEGRPLAGASVRATLVVQRWSETRAGKSVRGRASATDADGRFELVGAHGQPVRLRIEAPGAIVHPLELDALAETDDWESLELVAPLRCRLVIDGRGLPPPSDLLALLDERGERLWIELAREDAAEVEGIPLWRGVPLNDRSGVDVHCSEDARSLLFYDWDGTEIARRPIRLRPDAPTLASW